MSGEALLPAKLLFPISVKIEDGSIDTFDDVTELETGLEMYDSHLADGCEVRDALGRLVDLLIDNRLELKRFEIIDPGDR